MGIPAELSQVARTLTYTGTGVGAQIGIGTTLNVSGGAYVSGSIGIGTTNPTTTLQVNGTELIQSDTGSTQSVWTTTLDSKSNVNNVSLLVQPGTAYTGVSGRTYQPVVFSSALTNNNDAASNLYGLSNYTNFSVQGIFPVSTVYGFYNTVSRNSTADLPTIGNGLNLTGIRNEVTQDVGIASTSPVARNTYGNDTRISILNGATTANSVVYGNSNTINVGTAANYSASIQNVFGYNNVTTVGATLGTGIGTVTNFYSYYTQPIVRLTGRVTNYYGLYLAAPSVTGTLTNRWSIYSLDASSPMYHEGSVGIGTTNPTSKLSVVGNTLITGITTVNTELDVGVGGTIFTALPTGNIGIATTNPTATLHINGTTKVETSIGSTQAIWFNTLDSKTYNAPNVSLLVQPEQAYFHSSALSAKTYEPVIVSHALTSNNESNYGSLYGFQNYTNVAGTSSGARFFAVGLTNGVYRNSTTDISSFASNQVTAFSNSYIQSSNVDQSVVTGNVFVNNNIANIIKATATTIYGTFSRVNVGQSANFSANSANVYNFYSSNAIGALSGTGIGTVTNLYSYYARPAVNLTGRVTNYYGLYLDTPSVTGIITNRYSIYSTDASSPMYHEGSVGIGTTNPTSKLTVLGPVQLQNDGAASARLILRAKPGNLYRWNFDNDGVTNALRIFREDDATTANGVVYQQIDTSGRVTMPSQPSFLAYRNTALSVSAGWQLISNGILTESYDVGSVYSTTTNGRFVAPVAGKYMFYAGGYSSGNTNGERYAFGVKINNNGSPDFLTGGNYSNVDTPLSAYQIVLNLAANDYVELHFFSAITTTIGGSTHYLYWGGYLLG